MIPLKRHILANNRRCKCGYEVHFLGREVYTEGKNCRKAGAGYEKTVITIARSYGSGGKTLGNLLAKDLGINCYSREILRMASDESGINEALFGEVDEKMKKSPLLLNILKKNPYKGGVLPPESSDFVSDDNLFNYQAKVIKDLAAQESCIIIGRCADYVLKDNPDVIRLFFYAPLEDCIRRVVDQNGISAKRRRRRSQRLINTAQTIISTIRAMHGMMREITISVWILLR